MEKITLNLDDLKVESFHTTSHSAHSKKGTVMGYKELTFTCPEPCGSAGTGTCTHTFECDTDWCSFENCVTLYATQCTSDCN